jgi:WD40 repeat protein
LRFWDAATGEPFAEMVGTNEFIRAAALSPDGLRLAIVLNGRSSQRINVLDTTTAMTIASVTNVNGGPGGPAIESLIFDPGGDNLLWVDARHVTVNVADARTGLILKTKGFADDPGGRQYSRIARSPDGRTIAAYISGNSNVFLLDGRSLEPVRHWPHRQRQWLFSMSFSPDGTRLLTTSGDGLVRVWDVATGAGLHDLAGHGSRVHCAVYSPDGKRIASGGSDYNVRLWDAQTFEPVANLSGHQDYVYSLVWRADSQQIVSSSGDNTVRLWDTQPLTGRLQARRERQAILPKVERSVQRLWDELGDARKVVERIQADRSLSPRERQIAQQVALRKSVEQQKAATGILDQ